MTTLPAKLTFHIPHALAVHIAPLPTHIAGLPVAVRWLPCDEA